MAFESLKSSLLSDVAEISRERSSSEHVEALQALSDAFFSTFAAEDMRGRSADDLHGFAYGMLRFISRWDGDGPKVRILNPDLENHGWENHHTVVVILCRDKKEESQSGGKKLHVRWYLPPGGIPTPDGYRFRALSIGAMPRRVSNFKGPL